MASIFTIMTDSIDEMLLLNQSGLLFLLAECCQRNAMNCVVQEFPSLFNVHSCWLDIKGHV